MIITTSFNPDQGVINRVSEFSKSIGAIYVQRNKKSLLQIMKDNDTDELIVIEKEYAKYYNLNSIDNPFFFHPSLSAIRINRLKNGDNDLMVQISELNAGDSFLDCTLGLGSDAIVASYMVGSKGTVIGLESEKLLAAIVADGLHNSFYKDNDLTEAMRRIKVVNENHIDALKLFADNSFDIVFFDPMFRIGVNKSTPINPLRSIANQNHLIDDSILEAKRIAKRKVILKETSKSREFERLGFDKIIRSSSTTYGIISIGDN